MPALEPSPIKHEKPYNLKEKQQDYNELMATRREVKDALEKKLPTESRSPCEAILHRGVQRPF